MCLEHAINERLAAQLNAMLGLEDVNTIALLVDTSFSFNAHGSMFSSDMPVDLGDEEFSSVLRFCTCCKIINLLAN